MLTRYLHDFLEYSGLIFITWYFGFLENYPEIVIPLVIFWIAEGELHNLIIDRFRLRS